MIAYVPTTTRYQRWYGRDEPPVERRLVRIGPLVGELEGADLRYLRFGNIEVVRRVYAAVRDRNWGTVAPLLSDVRLNMTESAFALTFEAHNRDIALDVDFSWRGEIRGGNGTITFSLDGIANGDMRYNRIGWCILHPAENAGCAFRAHTPTQAVDGRLPREIGPQLMVDGAAMPFLPAFNRLEVEIDQNMWARFEFADTLFELEDQRNWTDASFKTYSAPGKSEFPHIAKAGDTFHQTVRLRVTSRKRPTPLKGDIATIKLGRRSVPLPAVGVGAACSEAELSTREVELLRAASLDHVRVDVEPDRPDWRDRLLRTGRDARMLQVPLELAVFVPDDPELLEAVAALLGERDMSVARLLIFRRGEATSSGRTIALALKHLGKAVGHTPVVGGTNILFTDINRFRPELSDLDGVAWPLNATIHAKDDTSVVETVAMHGETVRSARAFCGDCSLHVTPVTFKPRFNPYATGPAPECAPGELPPEVDPRQPSLLGAAWTVGSLRHLAESGASSVTYFETVGWRGLMETDSGAPVPERFPSWPGMVFPVYHILADVGGWKGGEVITVETSSPRTVDALAIRTKEALHVLVASLVPTPQRCRVEGIPAGKVAARVLDEHSFEDACQNPAGFRSSGQAAAGNGSSVELSLGPYAVARLDTLTSE